MPHFGEAVGVGGKGTVTYLVEQVGAAATVYDVNGNAVHTGNNDEVEINWALANLTAGRSEKETVKVIGEFEISNPILVYSYTYLDLTEARITQADNTDDNMIENQDQTNGNEYIDIFGGILDGNKANQASGNGIDWAGVTSSMIHGVNIINVNDRGINLYNANSTYCESDLITKNIIYACDTGIYFTGGQHVSIVDNTIDVCTAEGIRTSTIYFCNITDNNIKGALTAIGIRLYSTVECVIADNSISVGTVGIRIEGSTELIIVGNQINTCTEQGIYALTISNSTITGNGLSDNAPADNPTSTQLYLLSGSGNVISGNVFHAKAGHSRDALYDIRVSGDRNVIVGNANDQVQSHAILVGGDNCIISNNNVTGSVAGDGIHLEGAVACVVTGNRSIGNAGYGIGLDAVSNYNSVETNYTSGNTTGCANVANVNCISNIFAINQFDEGDITDVGTTTRAYANYDPSANVFITAIGAAPW